MNDAEKAGKIAAEALEHGCSLIHPGGNALEILDKIEEFIAKEGGKLAFPAQISINHVAAHCIPDAALVLQKDDVVKLDVGVHVNGFIGDNARTIVFSSEHQKLVEAAEAGLRAALDVVKQGITLGKIGGAIEDAIKQRGFKPIRNLSGHLLGEYEQHAGLTIPNYDDGDTTRLEEGMLIAIEPFATDGVGMIEERKDSGIYKVEQVKNVRDASAREMLQFILKEYQTLPFAKRWLLKKFPAVQVEFGLRMLKRDGILHEYQQLWEKASGLVSQAEHTVLVGEPCVVTTKEQIGFYNSDASQQDGDCTRYHV